MFEEPRKRKKFGLLFRKDEEAQEFLVNQRNIHNEKLSLSILNYVWVKNLLLIDCHGFGYTFLEVASKCLANSPVPVYVFGARKNGLTDPYFRERTLDDIIQTNTNCLVKIDWSGKELEDKKEPLDLKVTKENVKDRVRDFKKSVEHLNLLQKKFLIYVRKITRRLKTTNQ